jgi:hypothetical protein
MKKLMLSAAALMIGAIGFAQNSDALINQVGAQNDATVDQIGLANDANVDQFGKNFADVYQNGTSNVADVDQGTASAHRTNVALTGYYGAGSWVSQIGQGNNAKVAVTESNIGSRINQGGIDNDAKQFLDAYTSYRGRSINNYDGRMSIEIIQSGNRNEALQKTTTSFGTHGIQKMWIDQTGDDNYGSQHSKGGAGSVMTIKQVGYFNGNAVGADVSSTGLDSPLDLFNGSNGDYTQYQWGNRSTATIDITGDNNKTTQAQEYTVWALSGENTATINIIGNLNTVIQGQLGEYNESYVDISGHENVVTTGQEGDYNDADVNVDGDSNVAAVMQTGNNHEAIIWQSGNNNFGTITSNGNDHFGEIYQTGDMNNGVITQQN